VRRLPRPALIVLIALAVIVFLAISAILARVFSVDGAERAALTSLVQAEARGDQAAMLRDMYRCDAACRQRVAYVAQAYKRPGVVQIADLTTSAGFALGSTTGTARVAWYARNPYPVVQCIRVQRAGDALTGFTIRLLKISKKIYSDSSCPPSY